MKPGYLYVLVHPSDPNLVKIGVTVLKPEKRLAQHNRNYEEHAGKVVKETGQKWKLKTYIEVPDPYLAEAAFWGATPLADIPFLGGVEVVNLEWEYVEVGLDAAKKAGIRAPKAPLTSVRNREWMIKQLEGTGLTMIGPYGGLIKRTQFQCAKGHVFKKSAGVVAYVSKSCPHCVS